MTDNLNLTPKQRDAEDALLIIHAGAGGNDAQDWAEMVQRMYLRWAKKRGYETEIFGSILGEEVGIESTTILIKGLDAFEYLEGEDGVHRLVRISPFDSSSRRHTSFALVQVSPPGDGYPEPEWGKQIRSYILHPYTMVKDHRTNFETTDTESVLDGDLDLFMESCP